MLNHRRLPLEIILFILKYFLYYHNHCGTQNYYSIRKKNYFYGQAPVCKTNNEGEITPVPPPIILNRVKRLKKKQKTKFVEKDELI